MKVPKVQSKTVLVTGCSSGIGEGIAKYLRGEGWEVFPTARTEIDLEKLHSVGFDALFLDLCDSDSIKGCVSRLLRKCPAGIGAIVNNAGIAIPGAVEDLSREDLKMQFEVNVFGLQELTNRLIPTMRDQEWGRIVNISSIYGVLTAPMVGGYCASKYALEAISNAQRMELYGSGIGLSLVEPGPIVSCFRRNAYESLKNRVTVEHHFYKRYDKFLRQKLMRPQRKTRYTQSPQQVAKKVLHAITSDNPRQRYLVTLPAYAGSFLARILPGSAIDCVMKRGLNL